MRREARVILRGIRAVSDYEYELQMALMNRRLQPEVETVFLLAGEAYSFLSSRLVKEVISLGGNIEGLVPPRVERMLRDRLQPMRNRQHRHHDTHPENRQPPIAFRSSAFPPP